MLRTMTLSYLAEVDYILAMDVAIYAAPMSRAAGLHNTIHLIKGAGHVCPKTGGFDPLEIFDLAEHFGSAHMIAAPTMVKRMTSAVRLLSHIPSGLRTVVYGGGPLYVNDIIEADDGFGDFFIQIYGKGECPMTT